MRNLKIESYFYLADKIEDLNPAHSILDTSETAPKKQGGSQDM